MKDTSLLISTAAASALLAWAFWHYLGNDAFEVLTVIALITVTADNLRLRKKLQAGERE